MSVLIDDAACIRSNMLSWEVFQRQFVSFAEQNRTEQNDVLSVATTH